MPLPNTRVIHKDWSVHHRPAADGTQTAPGTVVRISEGPPPYPKPDGWTPEQTIHEAYFNVQPLQSQEGGGVAAEQPLTERKYTITTSVIGAPAFRSGERGDVILVLGRRFRISSIMLGTELWEIAFTCTENQTQQNPA